MITPLRLLSVSTATLLLVPGTAVDTLAFHAAEGTQVVRTFDMELGMELESLSMTLDGNELPADHSAGVEGTYGESTHVVVTDEYGAPGAGRPTVLRRTFDELSGETRESSSGPRGTSENNSDKSSELEGSTVVFTWDDEAEEYSVESEDDGDEGLLAGLVEDMDLRLLLPDEDVEEGDVWETDITPVRRLLEPGGFLGLESENELRTEIDRQLIARIDGEVRITYAGTREEAGVEVAVLALEVTATTGADVTVPTAAGTEDQQTVTMDFELEGELTWALEAGHLQALTLVGDLVAEMVNESEFQGSDGPMSLLQTMIFEGQLEFEVTVEVQ